MVSPTQLDDANSPTRTSRKRMASGTLIDLTNEQPTLPANDACSDHNLPVSCARFTANGAQICENVTHVEPSLLEPRIKKRRLDVSEVNIDSVKEASSENDDSERKRVLCVLLNTTSTHYDLLQVSRTSSLDAARRRYLRILRLFSNTDHMPRINAAYQHVCKSTSAREKYNDELKKADPLSYFPGDATAAQFLKTVTRDSACVIPFPTSSVARIRKQGDDGSSELTRVEEESGCQCYLPNHPGYRQVGDYQPNPITRMMLAGTRLQRAKCCRLLENAVQRPDVEADRDPDRGGHEIVAPGPSPKDGQEISASGPTPKGGLGSDLGKIVAPTSDPQQDCDLNLTCEPDVVIETNPHLLNRKQVDFHLEATVVASKCGKTSTVEASKCGKTSMEASKCGKTSVESSTISNVDNRKEKRKARHGQSPKQAAKTTHSHLQQLSAANHEACSDLISAAFEEMKLQLQLHATMRTGFAAFVKVTLPASKLPKKLGSSAPWMKSWRLLFTAITMTSKFLFAPDRDMSVDNADLWDCEPLTELAEAFGHVMDQDGNIAGLPLACELLVIRICTVLPRYVVNPGAREREYIMRMLRSFTHEKMLSRAQRQAFHKVICQMIKQMANWSVEQVTEAVEIFVRAGDHDTLRDIDTTHLIGHGWSDAELNTLMTSFLQDLEGIWQRAPAWLARCNLPLLHQILSLDVAGKYMSCAPMKYVLNLAKMVRDQKIYLPQRAVAFLAVRFAKELLRLRGKDKMWVHVVTILQVLGPVLLSCPKLALALKDAVTHYLPSAKQKRPTRKIAAYVHRIQRMSSPIRDRWPPDASLGKLRTEFSKVCKTDCMQPTSVSDVFSQLLKRCPEELKTLGATPVETIAMLSPDFRIVCDEVWYRPFEPVREEWNLFDRFLLDDCPKSLRPPPAVKMKRAVRRVKLVGGSSQSDAQMISIRGYYVVAPQFQHDAQVLEHEDDVKLKLPMEKRRTIYYHSVRSSDRGWWIGEGLESNKVWAFSPGIMDESRMPPVENWKVPWEEEVDPSVRIVYDLGSE